MLGIPEVTMVGTGFNETTQAHEQAKVIHNHQVKVERKLSKKITKQQQLHRAQQGKNAAGLLHDTPNNEKVRGKGSKTGNGNTKT